MINRLNLFKYNKIYKLITFKTKMMIKIIFKIFKNINKNMNNKNNKIQMKL